MEFPPANLKPKGNLVWKSGSFTRQNRPVLDISVGSIGLCTLPVGWKLSTKRLFYRALEQPSRLAGALRTPYQMDDLLETPSLVLGSLTAQLLAGFLSSFFCWFETELLYMYLAVL